MGRLRDVIKYLGIEIKYDNISVSPFASRREESVCRPRSEKFVNVVYRAVCGRKSGDSSSTGGAVNFKVPRLQALTCELV